MPTITAYTHSGEAIQLEAKDLSQAQTLVNQIEKGGLTRTGSDGFERYPAHVFAWFDVTENSDVSAAVPAKTKAKGSTAKAPRKRAKSK